MGNPGVSDNPKTWTSMGMQKSKERWEWSPGTEFLKASSPLCIQDRKSVKFEGLFNSFCIMA